MATTDQATQTAVNQWFAANPNATPEQVVSVIASNGGLTTNLAGALANYYGTDVNQIQTGYSQVIKQLPSDYVTPLPPEPVIKTATGTAIPNYVAPTATPTGGLLTPSTASSVATPSALQSSVNQWFDKNPNATPKQVFDVIKASGGLTPEGAQAIANRVGTTAQAVQSAYASLNATPSIPDSYAEQLKQTNPAAYAKIADIAKYSADEKFGGKIQDYQAQLLTSINPEKAGIPTKLQFSSQEPVRGTDPDTGLPITYIPPTQVLNAKVTPIEEGGFRSTTPTNINGVPIYAIYDSKGQVTGYEGDPSVTTWTSGQDRIIGSWDAQGNAKPVRTTNNDGNFNLKGIGLLASLAGGAYGLDALTGGSIGGSTLLPESPFLSGMAAENAVSGAGVAGLGLGSGIPVGAAAGSTTGLFNPITSGLSTLGSALTSGSTTGIPAGLTDIATKVGTGVATGLITSGLTSGTGGTGGGTGINPNLVQGGVQTAGGLIQTQASKDAALKAQQDILAATQQATTGAQFRPVGVTTRFGSSQFQIDPATGQLVSAGYTASPEITSAQNQLMKLGAGYLAQTPEQVAQDYLSKQYELLDPSRQRQLAAIRNQAFQTGRTGLSVGSTGLRPSGAQGLMGTNPEMEAYYNAMAQQDAQLAAQAQQAGQQQVTYGAGLFGQAGTLENLAQQPFTLGTGLGTSISTAGANAGRLNLGGQDIASRYGTSTDATTNPYATLLRAVGGPTSTLGAGINKYLTDYLATNKSTSLFDSAKYGEGMVGFQKALDDMYGAPTSLYGSGNAGFGS
jgi:hypothetical protein